MLKVMQMLSLIVLLLIMYALGFGHGSFTLFSYDYYKNILYKIQNN